jgi:hypothetical protein
MVESSWNVMAHGDAREGKWRGNWGMECVASTLHATSEHGVANITTADAHISAASSRLNWHPRRFKWTSPFRRKTKSGFCACAITFQTQSTYIDSRVNTTLKPYEDSSIFLMEYEFKHLQTQRHDHIYDVWSSMSCRMFIPRIKTQYLILKHRYSVS